MICKQCKEESKTSTITPGIALITCMYCAPYYDEQGKLHDHDYNTATVNYICSNEHQWQEIKYNTCWCGWTNKPKEDGTTE